ncbi:UNVERIFIED_CONTAM: hypothetical protein Slati_4552900 [Sesamum latifolium]|uniref:Uncharacterized protein n=1 Tax=Sesamum latifolium TaxID=2727402 RepID=A0AAW2S2N6_9LAMI
MEGNSCLKRVGRGGMRPNPATCALAQTGRLAEALDARAQPGRCHADGRMPLAGPADARRSYWPSLPSPRAAWPSSTRARAWPNHA